MLQDNHFYFIGLLFFAFTLFQAYTEFAQYFVVWNANMPSETFWYLIRENGSWWWVSMILIFGHFMIPFFILLPVAVKSNAKVVIPVCLWAWLMHALDLAFNILPAHHPEGFPLRWVWLQLGCFLFMGGFLTWSFAQKFCQARAVSAKRSAPARSHGREPERRQRSRWLQPGGGQPMNLQTINHASGAAIGIIIASVIFAVLAVAVKFFLSRSGP